MDKQYSRNLKTGAGIELIKVGKDRPIQPEPSNTLGDVNKNNKVDIVDALLIAQYYVHSNPSPFHAENADVNKDNNITIVDALLVAQLYVGIIDNF